MGILNGKTAVITGGGTGIGKAIAARYHAEGASVAICGRRESVLAVAAGEIAPAGERFYYGKMDVTQRREIDAFFEEVVTRCGGIDVLVNNAGMMRFDSICETGEELWNQLLDINLLGPWRTMRAAVPHLRARGGGAIINISSIAGHKALPNVGAYCTSKAALNMISQVAALEWASDNIRVNLIAPGLVEDTELADPIFGPEGVPAFYEKLRDLHPLGRAGLPRDVADLALFLAGEQSSWMTGVMVPLDGGRHLATNRPSL